MARSRRLDFTQHNRVQLIRGGAEYFSQIEHIIDGATYSLHLQTYIFDEDETGIRVAEALIRAAKRGVLVYVLLDGYASQKLSKTFIQQLQDVGVHFAFFEPVLKSSSFYFGRRLHHKVIVADAHICMAAGINISNRYNDMGATAAWLDWAVYAEGEVAGQLHNVCNKVWNRSVFRKRSKAIRPPRSAVPAEVCPVRIRRNDWVFRKTEITQSYQELFLKAETQATIMTSYFWPSRNLLHRMAVAVRRGVKVRLILTAVADVPFSKYAERFLYAWLFRHKIEIYEYHRNVLHGKIAVRDNEWITAGSYNVNNISAFASVELNLDIKSTAIATEVNNKLEEIIKNDCRHITEADFKAANNVVKQFFYYSSYRIVHAIFFLFTFYFSQKKGKGY
jgi:cardiolipin synthase